MTQPAPDRPAVASKENLKKLEDRVVQLEEEGVGGRVTVDVNADGYLEFTVPAGSTAVTINADGYLEFDTGSTS